MEEKSKLHWYEIILIGLMLILVAPYIIISLPFVLIANLISIVDDYRKYKKSPYYIDLRRKFKRSIVNSNSYIFYNYAKERNLPIEYIRQESDGFEYFLYNGMLFIIPELDLLCYNEEKREFEVCHAHDDIELSRIYEGFVKRIEHKYSHLPIKLLVERDNIDVYDLKKTSLPDYLYVVRYINTAFDEQEIPAEEILIPQNAADLYEMMLKTPDLGGSFELKGEDSHEKAIIWHFCKKVTVTVGVAKQDCIISINKGMLDITHWHPDIWEIYDDICNMGKKGNVIVIAKSLGGETVHYSGKKENCPYSPTQKHLFRKFYFLEADQ